MHVFAAGHLEAQMDLDSVRATLNQDSTGLSDDFKVVTYGFSGGIVSTGCPAALEPRYAPEISIVWVTFLGITTNATNTVPQSGPGQILRTESRWFHWHLL